MADNPISIRVDAREVVGFFNAMAGVTPVATAVALNRTAEWGTRIGRELAPSHFHIRSPQALRFAFPVSIPGKERATRTKLAVTIEPDRIGKIFGPFEEGVPHTTDRYGRLVAVPSTGFLGARPTPMALIEKRLFPHNLGLQVSVDASGKTYYALGRGSKAKNLKPHRVTASGKVQIKGKLGTFQIPGRKGPVILQRVNATTTRPLWYLRTVVKRPAELEYFNSVNRGANEHWESEMGGAFEYYQKLAESRA